jgi:DNA topoisomerase-1
MNILTVESPGKIKKIQSLLGNQWKAVASIGRVRDLPLNEIVAPPDFKPDYMETEKGREVLKGLRSLITKGDAVCLAADPDMEGEAIAWHLKEALSLKMRV